MHVLTATDIAGLRLTPAGVNGHQLVCPWCGEQAWAGSEHIQCSSFLCPTQAASPEDLLAEVLGGHAAAEKAIAKNFRRTPDFAAIELRKQRRRVMDFWVGLCNRPKTTAASQLEDRTKAHKYGINLSQFNACTMSRDDISTLLQLAMETGASYPENWVEKPPAVAIAFCVQSRPHIIDRLIIMRGSRSDEIVWNRYSSGFISLIGLSPVAPRLLATDHMLALRLQYELESQGTFEEISSIYRDTWFGGPCPRWSMDGHLLTAIVRNPRRDADDDEMLANADDIVHMQEVMDNYPYVAQSLRALPVGAILKGCPRSRHASWDALRVSYIAGLIPEGAKQVPGPAAALFERTGTKRKDSAHLIHKFKAEGRTALADDIQRLSETVTFYRDARTAVKETANQYLMTHAQGETVLANFSIKVKSSVMFDDQEESYCYGNMRCGNTAGDVLFPQTLLHNQSGALQDELQRQISAAGRTASAGHLPTVIQVNHFRKYVMPHLKRQIADAPLIIGTDRLGWRSDRKSFNCPGFTVDADGYHEASPIFCPSVSALRFFKARGQWANSCPQHVDQTCQDLIAMLLATNVRYYRRCRTLPLRIAQSSDAIAVLEHLIFGMGQAEVYELNQNMRDGGRINGLHGYPILAVGPRNIKPSADATPFIHLTDEGYTTTTRPDPAQIMDAVRALQFTMLRVVEWCLATSGDEFVEMPALMPHKSLLREGRWLLEEVCGFDSWSVAASEASAIERILEQIPYDTTDDRITLVDGENLVIDVEGLERDHDAIIAEAKELGTMIAIDDDKLYSAAARVLPAIASYYGQEPAVKFINSGM